MTNILLVCTAGMSTSFLVQKMKKEVEDRNIDVNIEAIPEASANDYVGKADIVLLGPQVKYLLNQIKEVFVDIPVEVINMVDYGSMNGKKVLDFALEKLNR